MKSSLPPNNDKLAAALSSAAHLLLEGSARNIFIFQVVTLIFVLLLTRVFAYA